MPASRLIAFGLEQAARRRIHASHSVRRHPGVPRVTCRAASDPCAAEGNPLLSGPIPKPHVPIPFIYRPTPILRVISGTIPGRPLSAVIRLQPARLSPVYHYRDPGPRRPDPSDTIPANHRHHIRSTESQHSPSTPPSLLVPNEISDTQRVYLD